MERERGKRVHFAGTYTDQISAVLACLLAKKMDKPWD